MGIRSQNCFEAEPRKNGTESCNITSRIEFSSQRKLMRKSQQIIGNYENSSPCIGELVLVNQKRLEASRVKKRLNGRKKQKSLFSIDKNLIAIEFEH